MINRRLHPLLLLVFMLLSACAPQTMTIVPTLITVPAAQTDTPAVTPVLPSVTPTLNAPAMQDLNIWLPPYLPPKLQDSLKLPAGLKRSSAAEQAILSLDVLASSASDIPIATQDKPTQLESNWVYALVAPFPTLTDGVTLDELQSFWKSGQGGAFENQPLLMTAETRTIFEKAWGKAGMDAIKVVDAEKLLDTAWADSPTWALVPFENLEPRWKVLKIEGLSPLDRSFDIQKYALTVRFGITGLPEALAALKNEPGQLIMVATNRDSEHMTVLMLTGTTAMVRYMALRMEENGVLYPVTDIRDEFSKADVVHISNEVPFYEKCPPAKPVRREMRFCSAPNYFDLLKAVGTDIVELTGNHELDWGYDPMLYTLDLYDKNGIKVYGGGKNDAEARKPLLFEDRSSPGRSHF